MTNKNWLFIWWANCADLIKFFCGMIFGMLFISFLFASVVVLPLAFADHIFILLTDLVSE